MKVLSILVLSLFHFSLESVSIQDIENRLFAVKSVPGLPCGYALFEKEGIHFSLGGLLPGPDQNSPFALITPLKNLLPHFIHLNCIDSMFLGSLYFDESVTVIFPNNIMITKVMRPYQMQSYNPTLESIEEATSRIIEEKGGWKVIFNPSEECNQACIDGVNINTALFFGPLLEKYTHITFDLQRSSCF